MTSMTSEQQVRLLRAKAGELENLTLIFKAPSDTVTEPVPWETIGQLTADIALVATLLADFIERYDREHEA